MPGCAMLNLEATCKAPEAGRSKHWKQELLSAIGGNM
jgi:hypothetical protein